MNACQKRIEELLAQQPAARPTQAAEPQRPADDKPESANPFARHIAKLREAMVSVVTEDDMQAIMQKMLAMAAAGSIPAMRLVMQYVIGKPTTAPNPDRVQLDEWSYFKETAAMTDDVPKVVKSLEPEACLDMAREVRPVMSDVAMKKYAQTFQGTPQDFDGCDRPAAPVPDPAERDMKGPPESFDGETAVAATTGTQSCMTTTSLSPACTSPMT